LYIMEGGQPRLVHHEGTNQAVYIIGRVHPRLTHHGKAPSKACTPWEMGWAGEQEILPSQLGPMMHWPGWPGLLHGKRDAYSLALHVEYLG